jgi:hypothetical protein
MSLMSILILFIYRVDSKRSLIIYFLTKTVKIKHTVKNKKLVLKQI